MRPRDQSVGDGLGVAQAAALGDLDGVDITDQVGHAGIGGGEFFGVALAAVLPLHRQIVAQLRGLADPLRGDRRVGMLSQLGPGDHRRPLVEQAGQRAQQPSFALAAFAEQNEIVTGDQRPLQLRQHGVVESEDARPDFVALGQRRQQILADFLLDPPLTVTGGT